MSFRFLLPGLLFFFACRSAHSPANNTLPPPKAERPKNIILLIGDGMATAQVSAGLYWKGVGKSVWERFPIIGFHKSHAHDERVPLESLAFGVRLVHGIVTRMCNK